MVWKTYDTWCLCVSPDILNIPDIPDIPNIPEDRTFQIFPIYFLAKTPGLYQVLDQIDLVVWERYDT